MDDRSGAQWLHAYMLDWADAVVRFVYDQTQDAEASQYVARQVFLAVVRLGPGEPLVPLDLFREADRWLRARGPAKPTPGWGVALSRLAPPARAVAALAAYGWRSFEDLAAASGVEREELFYALLRVQGEMGQHGVPPGSDGEWLTWLHQFGPPKPTAATAFSWPAWDPAARPRRPRGRVRPRHLAWAAAAALALAAGGYALHARALATTPPLPFAPTASQGTMHLSVEGDLRVAARPFGSSRASAVRVFDAANGLKIYRIGTITRAHLSTAYQIGPLHFGIAVGGGGTSLVLRIPAGPVPQVRNLAAHGQLVGAAVERRGFAVYRFPGRAGAARVTVGGKAIVLAWSDSAGPASYIRLESGAWSAAAGGPLARGPLGSRVFASPPGAGSLLGVLRDGVLWGNSRRWWLLPTRGAAIPLVRFLPYPPQAATVAAPYPASSNEVVVVLQTFVPGSGTQQKTIWWNLSQARWGATTALSPPEVLALPNGWVESLPAEFMSNQTPPGYVAMPKTFLALAAWGHDVFGGSIAQGGGLTNAGTYDWATRTLTPARAAPPASTTAGVKFPGWGPTWVACSDASTGPLGNDIAGPATVRLVAADGSHRATIKVQAGQNLIVEDGWLAQTSTAAPGATAAAWPDAAGQIRWHAVNPGGPLVVPGNGFLYWMAGGHTYVWMPPFAWPARS